MTNEELRARGITSEILSPEEGARETREKLDHTLQAYARLEQKYGERGREIARLIGAHKREVGGLLTRISDLELWIGTVGRMCPSNDTISDFLLGQD
jgi:hypothetical protein